MGKFDIIVVVLLACLHWSTGFIFTSSLIPRHLNLARNRLVDKDLKMFTSRSQFQRGLSTLTMCETSEVSSEVVEEVFDKDDFNSYKIGQEYDGRVTAIKSNGARVNFTSSVGVIIPKSRMSVLDFEKLKGMYARGSMANVSIEIIDFNATSLNLYGKYTDKHDKQRTELTGLAEMDPAVLRKIRHNATVVSAHMNGLTVQLDEYAIAGFVPHFRVPDKPLPANIPKLYRQGRSVVVCIEHLNVTKKEIVLSMPQENLRTILGDVGTYIDFSADKWVTGEVVKVFQKALHVRPAYHITPGVVSVEKIPRELIDTLKNRVSIATKPDSPLPQAGTTWDTDLRRLLNVGDVLKVRVQAVDFKTSEVTLTMQPTEDEFARYFPPDLAAERKKRRDARNAKKPHKRREKDTTPVTPELLKKFNIDTSLRFEGIRLDDIETLPEFLVEPEPEPPVVHRLERDGVVAEWTDEMEEADYERDQAREHQLLKRKMLHKTKEVYYPEKVLEWWRGAPFVTSYELADIAKAEARAKSNGILEAHDEIMAESAEMVAGTWRRLFVVDSVADSKDYEQHSLGRELRTIEDEIGEMDGFQLHFEKPINSPFEHTDEGTFPMGASIDRNTIPLPYRDEITFYKKLDAKMKAMEQQDRDDGFRPYDSCDGAAILKEYYRIEEDARKGKIEERLGWKIGDPEINWDDYPAPPREPPRPRRVWKKKGDLTNPAAVAAAASAAAAAESTATPKAEDVSESLP